MAAVIDKNACIACGACVGVCPVEIIELGEVAVITDEAACIECGACVDACPLGVISI
jgi:ferredoxin